MKPLGADEEAIVGLRTQPGEAWGILALYREPGQHRFDADELQFLRQVSGSLAEGARRETSFDSGPGRLSGLCQARSETRRAKTTMRFVAENSGWQAERTKRS